MNLPQLISITELWEELGYTKSTFYRRITEFNLVRPGHRLLSPREQDYYRVGFGFPPKFSPSSLPNTGLLSI